MGEDRWLLSDVVAKLQTQRQDGSISVISGWNSLGVSNFLLRGRPTSLPPAKVHRYVFSLCSLPWEWCHLGHLCFHFSSIKICQQVHHGLSCLGELRIALVYKPGLCRHGSCMWQFWRDCPVSSSVIVIFSSQSLTTAPGSITEYHVPKTWSGVDENEPPAIFLDYAWSIKSISLDNVTKL